MHMGLEDGEPVCADALYLTDESKVGLTASGSSSKFNLDPLSSHCVSLGQNKISKPGLPEIGGYYTTLGNRTQLGFCLQGN